MDENGQELPKIVEDESEPAADRSKPEAPIFWDGAAQELLTEGWLKVYEVAQVEIGEISSAKNEAYRDYERRRDQLTDMKWSGTIDELFEAYPELKQLFDKAKRLEARSNQALEELRKVQEKLLPNLTKPIPGREFIEPRQVAAPSMEWLDRQGFGCGYCRAFKARRVLTGLSEDNQIYETPRFARHRWPFDTVYHPTCPSDDSQIYFEKPENLMAPELKDPVDRQIWEMYRLLKIGEGETQEQLDTWLNWALAGKIVGLANEVELTRNHRGRHKNESRYPNPVIISGTSLGRMGEAEAEEQPRILTKEEVMQRRAKLMAQVVRIHKSEGPASFIIDEDTALRYWDILSAFRYDQNNELGLYNLGLGEWLEMYSELNYLMETTYRDKKPKLRPFCLQNSLAHVMMGGRHEGYYDEDHAVCRPDEVCCDEVDAIFIAAIHALGEDSPWLDREKDSYFEGRSEDPWRQRQPALARKELPRWCLFSNFRENIHGHAPIGGPKAFFEMMVMQYLRLDEKLKQAWRPVLLPLFKYVFTEAKNDYRPAHWNSCEILGTSKNGKNLPPEEGNFHYNREGLESADRIKADLERVYAFEAEDASEGLILRGEKARPIKGFGTDKFEQTLESDEWGPYLRLRPKKPQEEEKAIELAEQRRLEIGPKTRLPPEALALVERVELDPKAGELDKVGMVGRILERLTGRKPGEDLDIVQTITMLGTLKQLGQEILTADRSVAEGLLFEAKFGQKSFRELDPASQILIMLRTTGMLPKSLIIENLIGALDGAVPVALLRYCLTMEQRVRDQQPWATGEDELFVFPLFTGREAIAAAREKHGEDSPGLRKAMIRKYCELLGLMQIHHSYESSVTDLLTMLELMEETGRPMSQCTEMAYLACELMNLMAGEGKPQSRVYYRERFADLPLNRWLGLLQARARAGNWLITFDHVKIRSELPDSEARRKLLVDETTGHADMVRKTQVDQRRSSQLRNGEYLIVAENAGNLDYTGRKTGMEKVAEGALVYDAKSELAGGTGAGMLGHVVGMFPGLETYAEALAPDDPVNLENLIAFTDNPEKKWAILDRLLRFAPREIADNRDGRDKLHQERLRNYLNLCLDRGKLAPSVFVLNVWEYAYPELAAGNGVSGLRERVFDQLGLLAKKELAGMLKDGVDNGWLTSMDIGEARRRYQAKQEEIRRRAESRKINLSEAAVELKQEAVQALSEAKQAVGEAAAALPEDLPDTSVGRVTQTGIVLETQMAGHDYQADNQVELPPDLGGWAADWFAGVDSEGAKFALAEMMRGLKSDEEKQQMLLLLELVVLAAGRDYKYNLLPGGEDLAWQNMEQAVKAAGFELPVGRRELQLSEGKITAQLASQVNLPLLAVLTKSE